MEGLIQGPFAEALQARRERYNALFAQARRISPGLDAGQLAEYLRSTVAPIIDQVARVAPERVPDTADALYEFSLDLVGRELLARYPVLAEGWRELLGGLPEHLASAPRLLAGSVTNALVNLSTVPGTRAQQWIGFTRGLGRLCADVPTLLEAAKVAAWRAGMAHYREGALETCARLPPPLARAALRLFGVEDGLPIEPVLERLRADPWLHPALLRNHAPIPRNLRVVARVGAFRGFGGTFLRPPVVAVCEGQFYVSDGEACWLLSADVFGATLERAGTGLPGSDPPAPAALQMDREGVVRREGLSRTFPELREAASSASDGTTLAVTVPLSHAVYLVAVASDAKT